MKTRPQVTDEEIKVLMDFDDLLDQKDKLVSKHRNFRRVRNLFIGFVSVLTILSLVFFLAGREGEDQPLRVSVKPAQPALSPPVGTDTIQSGHFREEKQSPPAQRKGKEKPPVKPKGTEEKESSGDKEQARRQQPVYVQAEPLDGYPALYDYFDRNLVYPPSAAKEPVEGVVDVAFVIDTTGNAINIRVENSLGEVFDNEVIRLMDNMPAWRPASYNGKPVQSKISLPVTFSVKKNNSP